MSTQRWMCRASSSTKAILCCASRPAPARRPAPRPRSTHAPMRGGWRRWGSPARSTFPAAPRAARVRHRPTWCWSARTAATALCATVRRAIRPGGRSRPTSSRRCGAPDMDYIRDGAEIYAKSFAIIRAESDLARFSKAEERVAVRIIHACGMTEVARDIVMSPGFADNARWALVAGAPVLCDSKMVANGITRARLPAANEVVCTLDDPKVPEIARRIGNTRSAAAMDLWGERLAGAVVAIGNAPTALFRLFELLDAGAKPPAAVIGLPVGFVGAAESKQALANDGRVPFLIVKGRKGGSAMAAAAVNALASEAE